MIRYSSFMLIALVLLATSVSVTNGQHGSIDKPPPRGPPTSTIAVMEPTRQIHPVDMINVASMQQDKDPKSSDDSKPPRVVVVRERVHVITNDPRVVKLMKLRSEYMNTMRKVSSGNVTDDDVSKMKLIRTTLAEDFEKLDDDMKKKVELPYKRLLTFIDGVIVKLEEQLKKPEKFAIMVSSVAFDDIDADFASISSTLQPPIKPTSSIPSTVQPPNMISTDDPMYDDDSFGVSETDDVDDSFSTSSPSLSYQRPPGSGRERARPDSGRRPTPPGRPVREERGGRGREERGGRGNLGRDYRRDYRRDYGRYSRDYRDYRGRYYDDDYNYNPYRYRPRYPPRDPYADPYSYYRDYRYRRDPYRYRRDPYRPYLEFQSLPVSDDAASADISSPLMNDAKVGVDTDIVMPEM